MFLLALMLLQDPPSASDTTRHSGRAGETAVHPPRLSGEILLDGILDEPQWQAASRLTGFSELTPVDGVAATDTTEVRVWYSPTALYIGIHAIDRHGTVRATLATRDQIFNDDNVQVYLSTFNDGRQATVFAVNPFGVQADGALNESGTQNCGFSNCATSTRQAPNLSPDFVWQSKGRVTPDGYDVEMRIPFKSIRFQAGKTQTWGINILRVVQRQGQEQTWTAARMGASSFLGQSGTLVGLTGIEAGHTLDIIPTATTTVTGAAGATGGAFDYNAGRPQLGADLAYGITPNLTLHATAHPDFSQVESDVTQFAFDPRQAVFYPEKRPFFLDGVEQFDAPSNLIHTRSIVQPVGAGKVTGKIGNNQVGALVAVDSRIASRYSDNPVFGVLRASHDLGPGSRVGMTWTEQHDGAETNRVIGGDTRFVLGGIHSLAFSGALSHDDNGITHNSALWSAAYRRNGRNFRSAYSISGVGNDFVTRTGFISQRGVANAQLSNSYTLLWPAGRLQSLTSEVVLGGFWRYDDLIHGGQILNRQLHFNFNGLFRGGWKAGAGYYHESFGYDSTIYTNYLLRQSDGSFMRFTGNNARLPNNDYILSFGTPTWKRFDFNGFALLGANDENYKEWASGRDIVVTAGLDFRPSDHLRLNVSYNDSRVYRPSDNSRVLIQDVAVATLEYQISRAFQVRVIPQYSIDIRDSLRDDSRTNLPIYIVNRNTGVVSRAGAYDRRSFQANFLFTYLPNPGTVVYLGYGSVSQRPNVVGLAQLGAVQSSLFLKLSYLFRMRG